MRAKYLFWLLVILWHGLILGLLGWVFREQYLYFLLSQPFVLLSLLLAWQVYRHYQRPFMLMEAGKGALQDRDFSVKFRSSKSSEWNELIGLYNQMIDSLREERTVLQEQHYFLQKLIEASPSGILILDHDRRITVCNPAAVGILGFNPMENPHTRHPLLDVVATMESGDTHTITLESSEHYRVDAGDFMDRGFPRMFLQIHAMTHDILVAEKRAYGKVIRMMAHEVNNSIGAVNSLLQTFADTSVPVDESWVEDIRSHLPIAIMRNERLNVFMRNFAEVVRLPQPLLSRTNITELIADTVQLLLVQAEQQQTQLVWSSPTVPLYVQADPHQMEQVFINIIRNAMESLQRGGQIKITLQDRHLTIADNGPGLSDEAAAAIFTPFYTTKPNGQGIGLTLIREILSNHHFRFSLQTGTDGWTRFAVFFDE
ncbi:MAG: ATP-binding protein [Saprospiraceae bacterium]